MKEDDQDVTIRPWKTRLELHHQISSSFFVFMTVLQFEDFDCYFYRQRRDVLLAFSLDKCVHGCFCFQFTYINGFYITITFHSVLFLLE